MYEGAFALIDCLGFKGIWKKHNPDIIIKKLNRLNSTLNAEIKIDTLPWCGLFAEHIKVHACLISDTVAVSIQYLDPQSHLKDRKHDAVLVGICCRVVGKVMDLFLNHTPSLVMRGCIVFGEHLAKGNFFIGPAVDEAAEHMGLADGAFVWLSPSSYELYCHDNDQKNEYLERMFDRYKNTNLGNQNMQALMKEFNFDPLLMENYSMPVKMGRVLSCAVINPIGAFNDSEKIITLYRNAMQSNSLDVWIKLQNTLNFLKLAKEQVEAFNQRIEETGQRLENDIEFQEKLKKRKISRNLKIPKKT